ncbi:hypothetical protein [Cognaticolwellia mytili]|uniref:hypothetical protein n=1 Tax=Cognaticolwellia mytili TaxID=1888913 RepID=UPI001301DEA2|nr:hypothetical protein [Cognaticolwellia mytili]
MISSRDLWSPKRKQQISLVKTSYYHCVRWAFLYGEDKLHFLTQVFIIDVCVYAVTSHHYYVVLFIDEVKTKQWNLQEVLERWYR